MNFSCFRNIIVLDETGQGLPLLLHMVHSEEDERAALLNTRRPIQLVSVSDFPGDHTEFRQTELEARIKSGLELGWCLIIVNAARVLTALYDVTNQHFTSMTDENGNIHFYARIGVGSTSRDCRVHPEARLIIYVTKDELVSMERPLLARFDKYRLSVHDVLSETLRAFAVADPVEGPSQCAHLAVLSIPVYMVTQRSCVTCPNDFRSQI